MNYFTTNIIVSYLRVKWVKNSLLYILTEVSEYSGATKLNFLQISDNIAVGLCVARHSQYPDLEKT